MFDFLSYAVLLGYMSLNTTLNKLYFYDIKPKAH